MAIDNSYRILPSDFDSGWTKAVEDLFSLKISSLIVKCPACRKSGLIFPYWIPKVSEKPVFVSHFNRGRLTSLCALNKTDAGILRSTLSLSKEDIKTLLKAYRPVVLFSGGKDSLCTLSHIKRINGRRNGLIALHADTTAGLPRVSRFVKRVCKRLDVNLIMVKPDRDFFDLAKKWGIPSARSRWCCKTLKIRPMRDYLKTLDEPFIVIDGIRAAESNVRAKYLPLWYHPTFKCLSLSPLIDWSDEDITAYIKKTNLPKSPAYKLGISAECFCGAYANRADFEVLLDIEPEMFDKLAAVERTNKNGYTFIYEKGERIPLRTIKQKAKKKSTLKLR